MRTLLAGAAVAMLAAAPFNPGWGSEKTPPQFCTGPDCLAGSAKPAENCTGLDCGTQLPSIKNAKTCADQNCDPIIVEPQPQDTMPEQAAPEPANPPPDTGTATTDSNQAGPDTTDAGKK